MPFQRITFAENALNLKFQSKSFIPKGFSMWEIFQKDIFTNTHREDQKNFVLLLIQLMNDFGIMIFFPWIIEFHFRNASTFSAIREDRKRQCICISFSCVTVDTQETSHFHWLYVDKSQCQCRVRNLCAFFWLFNVSSVYAITYGTRTRENEVEKTHINHWHDTKRHKKWQSIFKVR